VFIEVKTLSQPNICSPGALLSFTDMIQLNITIFNTSFKDIFIPANSHCAAIEICEDSFEVFHMNFSFDNSIILESNNLELIQSDSYMDEDKKEQAFLEY